MAQRVKASFVEPMLLLRSGELPDDDAWLKELKLDGLFAAISRAALRSAVPTFGIGTVDQALMVG